MTIEKLAEARRAAIAQVPPLPGMLTLRPTNGVQLDVQWRDNVGGGPVPSDLRLVLHLQREASGLGDPGVVGFVHLPPNEARRLAEWITQTAGPNLTPPPAPMLPTR